MATSGTVRLSVDLGTTWTAAGASKGGEPEPIMLGSDGPAMPSVVAVVNGEVVAGAAAARAATVDPASAAREFKRRLGDTAPIVLGGTPYGAETLMGHLLAHVVKTATAQVGAPEVVTLTHPAVFGEYKLDLLREAARVAGLADVGLLSEPEAAALQYARLGRLKTGDTVAVYDFGGGTFDAAIVRLDPDGPKLLGRPEGLERLGGIDLDHAVLAHVDASLDGALSQLDTSNPDVRRAVTALRDECVRAKEALSADTEVSVPVTVPGLDTVVRVTRSEFETFVRPRLAETLGALDRAIASAGLTAGDLAGVVLVGGSSRIPVVVEQVGAHAGRPLLVDADPKLVVALGAVPDTNQKPTAPEEIVMATTTPPAGGEPAAPKAADDPKAKAPAEPGAPGAGGGGGGAAKDAPRERRTAPGAHEPEKGGLSTAGKVAAGVAAAGLAAATAAFWRDDIENAVGLGDDDGPGNQAQPPAGPVDPAAAAAVADAPDPAVLAAQAAEAAAAAATAAPVEESMDAFDAVAGPPPAPAPRFAPQGGGGGGGGVRQAARVDAPDLGAPAPPPPPPPAPAPAAARSAAPPAPAPAAAPTTAPATSTVSAAPTAPAAPPPTQTTTPTPPPSGPASSPDDAGAPMGAGMGSGMGPGSGMGSDDDGAPMGSGMGSDDMDAGAPGSGDGAFDDARDQLQQRLADWQPPDGADPAEVAQLRSRLEGLLDRYEPGPNQSVDQAIADLRDQFELRIDNFTQDQKIDALVDELGQQGGGMPAEPDPEFEASRAALRDSLANWQAPEGTSPEDAAELKAQLQSLVDTYEPRPGQSADAALASLRAEFDDQVHDFTQDQKIDALVEQAAQGAMPAGPDPEFEASRAALRDSLADWQAPEGTSPEDAAELKAQLQSLVDTYQPQAGLSADDALAALRAEFDDQVHDFTQDQKIDALVDEVSDLRSQTGMPAGPDPEFEAQRDALRASLDNWQAPEGTSPEDAAELKAQLQTLVDDYRPQAGLSADDAMSALQAQFQDQVHDFAQDQKIDALVDAQAADDAAQATAVDGGDDTGAGGAMQTQVLVDDFDEMIGEPTAVTPTDVDVDAAPRPGFAMGEPTPGEPVVAAVVDTDIDDDMFAIPDGDAPMTIEPDVPTNTGIVPPAITMDDDDVFGVGDLTPAAPVADDTPDTDGDVDTDTGPDDMTFGGDLDQPDTGGDDDMDMDLPGMHDPLSMTSDDLTPDDDLSSFGSGLDHDDMDDMDDVHVDGMSADDMNDPMSGFGS